MSILTEPISLIAFGDQRKIGKFQFNATTNESTSDVLTITKQPVQQGAAITDHAFKEPTTYACTAYTRPNFGVSLAKLYQDLLDYQSSRVPFDIVTPKRIYRSMLIASISQTTDTKTENVLALNMSFQEVIIVKISTTTVPRTRQKNAGATGKTEPVGKKQSSLFQGAQALKIGSGIFGT